MKTREKKEKYVPFKDCIIYEDEAILLINKPPNIASLDDKEARNIHSMAVNYDPELKLCHRIDKATSGILLLAKGAEHYRNISLQFQYRKVEKIYHTLVHGIHRFEEEMINLPLLATSNKRVVVHKNDGKRAETIVSSIHHYRNYSLLACKPITGRMHQIRVHLSAQGCPIVGDLLYGGSDILLSKLKRNYKPNSRREELPVNNGFLLHAKSISFEHPTSQEKVQFEAPYPKNFEVVLKVLDKYN